MQRMLDASTGEDSMRRRFAIALLGTAAFIIRATQFAIAADMAVKAPVYKAPVAPLFNWTGFYLGIEGGGAWGSTQSISADPTFNPGLPITDKFNVSGALFGGTVGYNWQTSNWVFGLEGDISWVHKTGTVNDILPFTLAFTNTTTEHWLGTGRVRLGMTPVDRWLIYATGGFAVAGVEDVVDTITAGAFSDTHTRWGWTIGGGVEAAISQNWSIKAEYLFVDLQDANYFDPQVPIGGGAAVLTRTVTLNNNIVRAGLNFRLGGGMY
jgi:outer membrane immunogenic protein